MLLLNANNFSRVRPDLLLSLWSHFSRRRQWQFGLLLVLMLVSALVEVASLGAVLPFLAVLTTPERAFRHPFVASIAQAFSLSAADQLVLPITIAFVTAAVIAGAIRLIFLWASTRLAYATGADLSIEVYRRTLYQPYQVHLARNSSEVISGIINKVNGVTFGVLMSSLTLISSFVLLISILFVLITIDPMVASVAVVCFGTSYALIGWFTRQRLKHNSLRVASEQTHVIKALQEGLGGIRDVLLNGTQPVYCGIYRQADHQLRRSLGDNVFISGSTRPIMESSRKD